MVSPNRPAPISSSSNSPPRGGRVKVLIISISKNILNAAKKPRDFGNVLIPPSSLLGRPPFWHYDRKSLELSIRACLKRTSGKIEAPQNDDIHNDDNKNLNLRWSRSPFQRTPLATMSTLIVTGALVILHMRMVVILMRVMIKDVGIPVNDDKI